MTTTQIEAAANAPTRDTWHKLSYEDRERIMRYIAERESVTGAVALNQVVKDLAGKGKGKG